MQSGVVHPNPQVHRDVVVAIGLAVVTFVVFVRALDCGFINFDDQRYVTGNEHVTKGLTLEGVRWAFSSFECANWHPLTWLSLQLDASLWWPNPRGFHLTNVLLHAGSTALLFLALRALTGCTWRSVVVALLFGVHPLRVESVAWVAERKDVLSSFFGLLSLWAYARYVRRPGTGRYLAIAVPFGLGLLAKPMLVTLPFLFLVLDWWPLGRARTFGDWGRLAMEKLPLLALALASAAVTFRAQDSEGAVMGLEKFTLAARVENALVSYVIYLGKTIWPARLAIYYPHPAFGYPGGGTLSAFAVGGAGLILLATTGVALALRQRAPYLLTGWLWYLGMLVPVIGLVQVGNQAYADRYTYLPQVGIWIAFCWGIADLAGKHARVALGFGAGLATAFAVATWFQLGIWREPIDIWRQAVRATGPNPVALCNLAELLNDSEAARCYREVLQIDQKCIDAHINLGNIFLRSGQLNDATREQEEALRINPKMDGIYCNLGMIEAARGDYARAAERFREALALRPNSAQAHSNLGNALGCLGKLPEAELEIKEALRLTPGFTSAHANLGGLLYRQKKWDAAAREEEKAIELDPGLYEAHEQLALIEMERGNYARATDCYQTALRLRPGSLRARNGLGTGLLQAARVKEALAVLSDAVREFPQDGLARFNLGMALEAGGDLEGAARQFEAATRLSPGMAQAWYDLGRVRALQGRPADASASFEQAVSRDAKSERYRKALEAARKSLDKSGASGAGAPPR